MTATHSIGRHRDVRRRSQLRGPVGTAALMAASAAAGWVVVTNIASDDAVPEATTVANQQPVAAQEAGIHSAGQITAVSWDSLTTTTADGRVTTFRITPDTTQITQGGSSTAYASTSLAPTQSVLVVGVVHDGVAVATTIADQAAVGPNGAPMDYGLPA